MCTLHVDGVAWFLALHGSLSTTISKPWAQNVVTDSWYSLRTKTNKKNRTGGYWDVNW